MRKAVYEAMLRAPFKIVGGLIGLGGIVSSLWPDDISRALGVMSGEDIRLIGIIALVVAVAYFAALWLLKPSADGADKGGGVGQSARTAGDGAPAMAAGRDIHYHAPSPSEQPYGTGPIVTPLGEMAVEIMQSKRRKTGMNIDPHALLEVEGHPPRKPDLPLNGLLVQIYKWLGGCPADEAGKPEFYRKVNLAIQDGITIHGLNVWGRAFDFGADRIPQDRLRFATLDHRRGILRVGPSFPGQEGLDYTDLQFNRQQVGTIWPTQNVEPAQGSLPVARDKGLPEALAYAVAGEWGLRFFDVVADGREEENGGVWQRFRQRAHDGALTVWGKRSAHGVHEKIDPSFWVDHDAEWFDLLRGIGRTESTNRTAPAEQFTDLMVSSAEFEREWHHYGLR